MANENGPRSIGNQLQQSIETSLVFYLFDAGGRLPHKGGVSWLLDPEKTLQSKLQPDKKNFSLREL